MVIAYGSDPLLLFFIIGSNCIDGLRVEYNQLILVRLLLTIIAHLYGFYNRKSFYCWLSE